MNVLLKQQASPKTARNESVEVRLTVLETRWEEVIPTLATKEDLLGLKAELKKDLHDTRTELKEDLHNTRTELKEDLLGTRNDLFTTKSEVSESIAQLRTDMHKMEANMTRWMLGTIIGLFIGFAGMFFAQQRSLDTAIDRLDRKIDRLEQLYFSGQSTPAAPVTTDTVPSA